MRNNMTRAGVALGSAAALVASAFAGLPASAAGQADTSFVSLTPTNGYSYNVLAIAGQTFSLDANQASSITANGRNVKFLVEDPNEVARPAAGTGTTTAAGTVGVEDWSVTSNVLTIEDQAHGLVVGDYVYISGLVTVDEGDSDAEATINPGWRKVTTKADDSFTVAFTNDNVLADNGAGAADVYAKDATGTYFKFARATDKSFVVNTGVATNTSDKVLVLENIASTATVSVTVTAWVDDNGDGKISSTEYASPARVVTWVKPSTVVPTVTWNPVVIGDDKMSATVTLAPTINFDQQSQAKFEVDFQRQGSTDTEGTTDGVTGITDTWDTEDEEWTVEAVLKQTANNTPWTGITKQADLDEGDLDYVAKAGKVVTIYTTAAHSIKVNDRVTVDAVNDADTSVNAYDESIFAATNAVVTAVSTYSFTYSVASNTTDVTKTDSLPDGTQNFDFTVASFGYATAGDYSATVKLGDTPAKIGSTSVISAGAQVAAAVKNKATVTENVSSDFKVRKGHVADVQVTTTVKDSDGVAVAAGTPVSIAVSETSTGIVKVNGTTITTSKTLSTTTDANGQVVITVSNSSAAAGETVQLAVSSQGYSDTDTLTWEAAAYALTDLADNSSNGLLTRSVAASGDLAFKLVLKDQWGAAPAGDFRVKITGGGDRYDFVSYAAMSNGSLNWTLTDAPVLATDLSGSVVFAVQQLNASGSWVAPDGNAPLVALKGDGDGELDGDTIVINVRGSYGTTVSLNANGVSSADLAAASAVTALKAADTRTPGVAANDLSAETEDVTATITGTIKDKFTGAAQAGSVVTLTGNSAILFENGVEAAFGTITVIADTSGAFSVNAYSNAGLTDSVVTVAANGASSTVKVSFTGAAADGGVKLVVDAPASAAAGTTFQVTATLTDKYGNGVEVATEGDVKVTYTGPGLVVGALPKVTDEDGKLTFSVLLGSNDKGVAAVVVSYDQNSDGDFKDAKDLVVTKTIYVGQSTPSDAVVNAGSFNGYVAVYAKGYNGSRLSWKIAGKWFSTNVTKDYAVYQRKTVAVGMDVVVSLYIDGKLELTKTVTTR